MSCGIPLVSTNGGSLPEVVGDAGIIVNHSDPLSLYQGIKELLDDEEKRLVYGKMGRERVLDKFTWERAARELVDVYKEAIINANN